METWKLTIILIMINGCDDFQKHHLCFPHNWLSVLHPVASTVDTACSHQLSCLWSARLTQWWGSVSSWPRVLGLKRHTLDLCGGEIRTQRGVSGFRCPSEDGTCISFCNFTGKWCVQQYVSTRRSEAVFPGTFVSSGISHNHTTVQDLRGTKHW